MIEVRSSTFRDRSRREEGGDAMARSLPDRQALLIKLIIAVLGVILGLVGWYRFYLLVR